MSIVKVPLEHVTERWPSVDEYINDNENIFSPALQYGWIAGGCVRALLANEEIQDIDVFFSEERSLGQCAKELEERGGEVMKNNERVVDIRFKDGPKVQLVKILYESPEACIDSFDFTVSMFAFDSESFYMGPFSLLDMERKRIVIHKLSYPLSSFKRMMKYAGKGYYACHGCIREFLTLAKDADLNADEFYPVD